jgi:hypothetical protein
MHQLNYLFFFQKGNNEFNFIWLICVYYSFKKEYHGRPLFMENKIVSENALDGHYIFFPTFLLYVKLI